MLTVERYRHTNQSFDGKNLSVPDQATRFKYACGGRMTAARASEYFKMQYQIPDIENYAERMIYDVATGRRQIAFITDSFDWTYRLEHSPDPDVLDTEPVPLTRDDITIVNVGTKDSVCIISNEAIRKADLK